MRPLLCLVALLAAAPAGALDDETFLGYVRYHAKQLAEFPDELKRMTLAPPKFPQGQLAAEIESRGSTAEYDSIQYYVWVNKKKLLQDEAMIKASCKEADLPAGMTLDWVLAIQFLPTYLHELRHAHSHGVNGEFGNNLEEEVSGFITGAAAYPVVRKRWPEAYKCGGEMSAKDYRLQEMVWKREGVAGVRKLLKTPPSFYAKACSIFDGDGPVCCGLAKARFAKLAPLFKAKLSTEEDAKASCAAVAEQIKDDSCSSKETAMKLLVDSTVGKAFWCSPAQLERMKAYYEGEMARGDAEQKKAL